MGILKQILYSLLSVLILNSCYRDFTDEIDATPVLCINSLISAGEPIEVSVTRTWEYSDVEIVKDKDYYYQDGYQTRYKSEVNDATVDIYVNDILQTEDYIPNEGDHIRIVATSKKYGKAEGEVDVPICVPIESISWMADIVSARELENYWSGQEYFSLKFDFQANVTLQDISNEENYYHISCSPEYNDTYCLEDSIRPNFYTGTFKYESEPIFSEHIMSTEAAFGNIYAYGFTFFTNRQFMGDRYTLNLDYDGMEIQTYNVPPTESDFDWSICIELYTISKSYYDLSNYKWHAQDGMIVDLGNNGLGDSVWGYSNVSTGAGVIAAQSKASYKINLKDFFLSQMEQ